MRPTVQEVPEAKTSKSPTQRDLVPSDYRGLIERVVALGGSVAVEIVNDAYILMVMQDPDGNEFCINERLTLEERP